MMVLTDAEVLVNGVDLSDHVQQVAVETVYDKFETTLINDTQRSWQKGLCKGTVGLKFLQDFEANKVHQTLQPLLAGAPCQVRVTPQAGDLLAPDMGLAPSESLSPLDGVCWFLDPATLFNYTVLDGAVGEVAAVSAMFSGPAIEEAA
jgi:hypothetical protein